MVEYGYITQAECDAAQAETLIFTDTRGVPGAPQRRMRAAGRRASDGEVFSWFMDAVYDDAIDLICRGPGLHPRRWRSDLLYSAGYQIYTTLDMDIQNIVDSVYEDPSNFDYPSKPTARPSAAPSPSPTPTPATCWPWPAAWGRRTAEPLCDDLGHLPPALRQRHQAPLGVRARHR